MVQVGGLSSSEMRRAARPSGVEILLKFLMTGSTVLTSCPSSYGSPPAGWDTPEGLSACGWLGTPPGPLSVAQPAAVHPQPHYNVQAQGLQYGTGRSGIELGQVGAKQVDGLLLRHADNGAH